MAYQQTGLFKPDKQAVEFTNIRTTARAPVPDANKLKLGSSKSDISDRNPLKGRRSAYFPEASDFIQTAVYERNGLGVGDEFEGPAIIEDQGSTLIIGPGSNWEVSESGNIVVHMPE